MSTVQVKPPDEEQAEWIRGVATGLARAFPLVERQDIQQQLYVFWYEQWSVISKMVDHEKARQLVQTCLRRWGYNYAKSETATYRGWWQEDMQEYPPRMVADLLPFILDPEAWSNLSSTAQHSAKLKNATGDALAIYADLTKAWQVVGEGDRKILTQRYIMDVSVEMLSEDWDVALDTARKRVDRSLERLAVEMNGYARLGRPDKDGNTRKSLSNAQALSVTSDSWS